MTIGADILKELKLERIPVPRCETPTPRASISDAAAIINHRKALAFVDALETAAFERYIPDGIVINTDLDAHFYVPSWTYAVCVPTDRPAPVTPQVTLATGITGEINRQNQFLELALAIKRAYDEYGARGMSKPLIWRTSGAPDALGRPTLPLLGAIVVFDRRPPDGQTINDMMNDVGVIAPKEDITPDPLGLQKALDESTTSEYNSD